MSEYIIEDYNLDKQTVVYPSKVIKINNSFLFKFNYYQILACCGTFHIANAELYRDATAEDKVFIFKEIQRLAKVAGCRNIIYTDVKSDGSLNRVLEEYFECIHTYRNPNTDNIVEIRSFDLCPTDFDKPEADVYDDEAWEEDED